MGLYYRKRVRLGRNSWLNLSKRGVSVSARRGRATANTRGSFWLRLGRGFFYRGRWRRR